MSFLSHSDLVSRSSAPGLSSRIGIVLSVLLFVAITLAFCDHNFRRDARHLDFRAFYAAGQMVADGAGACLYDMAAQKDYQRRTIPDLRHEIYPFPYPPATALLYVPLTWLSLRSAYDVWCVLSIALLAFSLEALRRSVLPQAKLAWTLPLSLLYVPIGATLVNGQTAALELAVFTAAFVLFLSKQDFAAGLMLAVGLVKFNFVVPFVLVAVLARRFRLVSGFLVGAGVFLGICMMIAGVHFPATYWHFFASYTVQSGTITAWPPVMPNLRGLLFMIFRHEPPLSVVLAASVPVLWQTARGERSRDAGFAAAILSAVLLSYHANLHDLTLLVLPAFVVVAISRRRAFTSGITLLTLLPLLSVVFMVTHTLALTAVPVLFLLFAIPVRDPLAVSPLNH